MDINGIEMGLYRMTSTILLKEDVQEYPVEITP